MDGLSVRLTGRVLLCRCAILFLQSRWRMNVPIGTKWMANHQTGRMALVPIHKLSPVRACIMLILHLRAHGCGVRLAAGRQFRRSGSDLQPAGSAIEADPRASAVVNCYAAVVDVMHYGNVHIVDRMVVIEVTTTPVAALVANSDIAKSVVDAAIEADVRSPVATIKSIAVMPESPIARCPERTNIRSLHPRSRDPIVAVGRVTPIAGSPQVSIVGRRRLVVIGQGGRGLRCIGDGLRTIARIAGVLIWAHIVRATRIGRRGGLLAVIRSAHGTGSRWSVGCGNRSIGAALSQVGRSRVCGLILCAVLIIAGGKECLVFMASGDAKHRGQRKDGKWCEAWHTVHLILQLDPWYRKSQRRIRIRLNSIRTETPSKWLYLCAI